MDVKKFEVKKKPNKPIYKSPEEVEQAVENFVEELDKVQRGEVVLDEERDY